MCESIWSSRLTFTHSQRALQWTATRNVTNVAATCSRRHMLSWWVIPMVSFICDQKLTDNSVNKQYPLPLITGLTWLMSQSAHKEFIWKSSSKRLTFDVDLRHMTNVIWINPVRGAWQTYIILSFSNLAQSDSNRDVNCTRNNQI